MPHHHCATTFALCLLSGCSLLRDETTLSGAMQLLPGIEHTLSLQLPVTPMQIELTNRGPGTVEVSLADERGKVTRHQLAAGDATLHASADTAHAILHLASEATATVDYVIRTPSGCRIDWRQR